MPFDDQGARAPVVPTSKVTVLRDITKLFSLKVVKKITFFSLTFFHYLFAFINKKNAVVSKKNITFANRNPRIVQG
jgi:hypothetical protein